MTDYARRVARRWYIVVASVVIAVGLVFLHAVSGSKNTSTATASIYLGQPLASGGGSVITQTPQSNSGIAVAFVKSTATLAEAARAARPDRLEAARARQRARLQPVGGRHGRQRVQDDDRVADDPITVEGPWTRQRVQAAAESLANSLIGFENRYPDAKRQQLKARIAAEQAEKTQLQGTIDRATAALKQIDGSSLSPIDKAAASSSWGEILAAWTQQLGDISTQLPTDQIALAAVDSIESAQMITNAKGRQVSAIRRRSSLVVAAFIGLIVGIGLALVLGGARARRGRAQA